MTGGFEDILANDNVEGPTIVDIGASDFSFGSSGCGEWSRAE